LDLCGHDTTMPFGGMRTEHDSHDDPRRQSPYDESQVLRHLSYIFGAKSLRLPLSQNTYKIHQL